MIIDIILITIGVIGLFFASLFDIKTREVPDWLNYSMICIGLGLRLIYSLSSNNWYYFMYGAISFFAMLGLGSLMYYTKQWGGGDAKMVMALGALFATGPHKFFLPSLIINILIIGALYGLVFSIIFAIKNKDKFKKELKILFNQNKKTRRILIPILVILLIPAIIIPNPILKIALSLALIGIILYAYLAIIIKSVENACLIKLIDVNKLTEGDWITKDIFLNKKLIYSRKSPGVEKDQIELIKKTGIERVQIKEGIPFVPSIFISLLVSLVFGNLLLILL